VNRIFKTTEPLIAAMLSANASGNRLSWKDSTVTLSLLLVLLRIQVVIMYFSICIRVMNIECLQIDD
jgi:hypothetical protein